MIGFGVYIGILLLIGSIYDWKYYRLPTWILVAGGVGGTAGIIYNLLWEKRNLLEIGVMLLPGVGAVFLAYITHEQIGYGDGLFLLSLGGCLGLGRTIAVVMVALTSVCVVSVFLIICKKANRSSRIPFLPFLMLGYLTVMVGGWLT